MLSFCTSPNGLVHTKKILDRDAAAIVTPQETVFQCLGSWVRHVNVPGDDLVRNPLLLAAFNALGEQELFETAVDLLVEVRGGNDDDYRP